MFLLGIVVGMIIACLLFMAVGSLINNRTGTVILTAGFIGLIVVLLFCIGLSLSGW